MLLVDKSNIIEKLSENKPTISLNQTENENEDTNLSDLYTTDNIIINTYTVSKIEYTGLPSKSSFMNIKLNKHTGYNFDINNKNIPNNHFNCKPIIYIINKKREIPFLLYLLKYNQSDNEYGFIDIPTQNFSYLDDISIFISKFLNLEIKYSGFVTYEKNNYLFFECSNDRDSLDNIDDMQFQNQYKWALVSEIINNQKIYNIKISNFIKKIFLNNSKLLNLYNEDNSEIYESPSICYSLIDKRNRNEKTFYSSYDNILKFTENIEENEKKYYYISRGALFVGLIKCNNHSSNFNYYNDSREYNSIYNLYMPNVNKINLLIEINNKSSYVELSILHI